MAEVSNRVNFGSWVGRLTCPEKSGQREYPMISGLVRKKRYGIQCPENIGPASTWLGVAANFDDLVKFGVRRQIRPSQMFIKLAFEFGCEVIFMSHPITWSTR